VGAIGDDVDSLETVVTGHTRSITGLISDVSIIGESVDDLESTVSSIGDDITAINGKLDNTIEMTVEYPDGTSESFDVVVK
jgi:archaellum component FlaC